MIKTTIKGYELREPKKEDAKVLYDLIKDFSVYQKLEDEFIATVEDFEDTILNNSAKFLIAYYNDIPVGYCLYFKTFSTFRAQDCMYIEDVFIKEEYRKNGFGKEIFFQLNKLAKENNNGRVEWHCLDWSKDSMSFYENVIGAQPQREWIKFCLDEKAIEEFNNSK